MSSFQTLYNSGRVKRYHTADIPAQEIGQHSWGVCLILRAIYPKELTVPGHLYEAALLHDCAEVFTGDIPATAKWSDHRMDNHLTRMEDQFNLNHGCAVTLSGPEKRLLKWADTFELCLYCDHISWSGSGYASTIRERGLKHLVDNLGFPTTESKELYNEYFGK